MNKKPIEKIEKELSELAEVAQKANPTGGNPGAANTIRAILEQIKEMRILGTSQDNYSEKLIILTWVIIIFTIIIAILTFVLVAKELSWI